MSIRVSTRGVRTSVGPRAARVHFGTGRTRVSSGFGPFFASTSLGGGRRRSSTTTRRTPYRSAAPSAAQLARAERAAERAQQDAQRDAAIAQLQDLRWRSTTVHLQDFASAQPPHIDPPPELSLDWVEAQANAHHLQGLGFFDRSERRAAKERAHSDALAYVQDETRRLAETYQDLHVEADEWWAALCGNDEATVCEAVNTAFADNPAAGCAVGVSGSTLSIVMRQQDIDSLPSQTPGVTSAGRPTLKALTKKDRIGWWLTILCSNLVATAKEAFAVAPGITEISIAVLSRMPDTLRLGVVAYGTWTRSAIESTPWRSPEDAYRVFDIGRDISCSVRTTASGALSTVVRPLDIAGSPELTQLLDVSAVDDGVNALGELDSALALNRPDDHPPEADNPFEPLQFGDWLAARDSHSTPAAPADPTTRQLSPGERVTLPDTATFDSHIELTYRTRTPDAEADLSLTMLEGNGRVGSTDDFIFYNQPATADRSIRLAATTSTLGSVTERVELHLSMLPPRVAKILVALSMDTDGGLACDAIDSVAVTVTSGAGVWCFQPAPDPAIKAMVAVEFYRHTDSAGEPVWRLRAVGQGWAGGLAELARNHGVDID